MAQNADLLPVLLARREAFLGFLSARLNGKRADAEDILQHGLAKALAADTLRDDERLIPWFYQLLRHALIDHVRARQSATAREQLWSSDRVTADETERHLCACLEPLIATLPANQAELIRRARASLRIKLQSFCGDCSTGACLDCDCEP